ncbi:substrate-binding domain-containing protein [Streptomyces iakyrus]|uniref:substrate-binding domain-containing protein n=1 Tax=Streptomyces iakyrus TaxID=68219 RepID=UPI001FD82C8C
MPLDDDLVVATPEGDKRGAAEAVGRLLGLREPPTAVFAEQDEVAVAVIWTLRATRIEVPGQMSVVGFDDQPVARWFHLTTVAQSPSRIGREAGELALSLIDDPGADRGRHLVLPTHVIPRTTTAPPPAPRPEPQLPSD